MFPSLGKSGRTRPLKTTPHALHDGATGISKPRHRGLRAGPPKASPTWTEVSSRASTAPPSALRATESILDNVRSSPATLASSLSLVHQKLGAVGQQSTLVG